MRLALDHLTVGDAAPWHLVEIAAEAGYEACCLFLQSMAVLPRLPTYDLIGDGAQRRQTKSVLAETGVILDLAYPFTLTRRSSAGDFQAGLEAAADLGARAVNLLSYDRDQARAADQLEQVATLAKALGMVSVLEFYPRSGVGSLAEAVSLVSRIDQPHLRINLDILHLYRAGEGVADIAAAAPWLGYAQLADGPLTPPADRDHEAASQRQVPGAGDFDIAGFIQALPPGLGISVEAPDEAAMDLFVPGLTRAKRARQACLMAKI